MSTKTHPPSTEQEKPATPATKKAPPAEEVPVSYGFILTATVLICVTVWVLVNVVDQAHLLSKKSHPKASQPVRTLNNMPAKQVKLASVNSDTVRNFVSGVAVGGSRNMRSYYKNRAFSGAPPKVPHPVAEQNGKVESCLTCHGKGGYVPKFKAFAPVTPHPTFTNCSQCHVPTRTASLFKSTLWKRPKPPKIRRTPLPGGPPAIPHSLHLRTNCNACHAGPSAPRPIRTPHPERTNCLQCHVPRQRVAPFVSPFGLKVKKSTAPSRVHPTSRRKPAKRAVP